MAQATPFETRIARSDGLIATLVRASDYAAGQGHATVSLEHLLLALTEDGDAARVLISNSVDLNRLRNDVASFLGQQPPTAAPGKMPIDDPDLTKILAYAEAAARQSPRPDVQIDGAIVLAAIVGDGKSMAATFLKAQGLTFQAAIRVIRQTAAAQPAAPAEPSATPEATPAPPSESQAPASTFDRVPYRTPEPPPSSPASPSASPGPARTPPAQKPLWEPMGFPNIRPDPPPRPPAPPAPARKAEVRQPPAAPPPPAPQSAPEPLPQTPPDPPAPPAAAQPPRPAPPPPAAQPAQRGDAHARPAPAQVTAPPPAPTPAPVPAAGPPPLPSPDAGRRTPDGPPPIPPRGLGAPRQPPPRPDMRLPPNASSGAELTTPWPEATMERQPLPPVPPPPPYPPQQRAPAPGDRGRSREGAPRRPRPGAESGQLVENIPRRMKVGVLETIEIRIARDGMAISGGLQGGGPTQAHQLLITRAMSVRLQGEPGRFYIEPKSPETQWTGARGDQLASDYAVWRFTVIPQVRGAAELTLVVASRSIGSDGVVADTSLPEQRITVRVKANLLRGLKRWLGWMIVAVLGGLIGKAGESFWPKLIAMAREALAL